MCEKWLPRNRYFRFRSPPKVARNSRYCKSVMNVYLNVTSIGNKLQRDYKSTECEPSQFGSSRERIAAANAENPQCNITENVERAVNKDSPLTV